MAEIDEAGGAGGPPPDGAGGKAPAGRGRKFELIVPCTEDYRRWARRHAEALRTNVPTLVDQLLAKHAKEMGMETPPGRTGKEVGR